jgi:hypothetical protein
MRQWILVAAAALALPACASTRAAGPAAAAEEGAKDSGSGGGGEGTVHFLLMYLPNRVLDLFDVARAGVNVGPGLGGQVKVTDAAQAMYLSRTSVGVGLESLRHPPIYASAENAVGVGPLSADTNLGLGWYQSPTDVRLEAHPLIVGAHAAVDPVEIADFVLGFFGFDLREDDW